MQECTMERRAWADYRKRRTILVLLLIGYLPAGIFAAILSNALIGSDKLLVPVALCWMAAYAIAAHRVAHFPCPRCGHPFFFSGWSYVPWTRECLHCSWPKWWEFSASRDPPAPEKNGDEEDEEKVQCLSCGADMSVDMDRCPTCGWSYRDEMPSNGPMDRSRGSGVS